MLKYLSSFCFALFVIQASFTQTTVKVSGETLSHPNKDLKTGIMLHLALATMNEKFYMQFDSNKSVHHDSTYDNNKVLLTTTQSMLNSNGDSLEISINHFPSGKAKFTQYVLNDKVIFSETRNEKLLATELFYVADTGSYSLLHALEYNASGNLALEQVYDSSGRLICSIEYSGEQISKAVFRSYHYYADDLLSYVIVEDFSGNLHKVFRYYYIDGKLDYTLVYNSKGKEIERIPNR